MAATITNEDIILNLLLQKNEQGLRLLYRNYKDSIFGIIYNIVRSDQHAEEVLNDVFLKFYNNISSYDATKSRLFTWMARIAKNAAIDKVRTADYKQSNLTSILDPNDASEKLSHEQMAYEYSNFATVLNALDGNQKRLIQMIYLMGYTHQECADELNMPLGTVKTNVRRGLLHLREYFAKDIQAYLGFVIFIIIYICITFNQSFGSGY